MLDQGHHAAAVDAWLKRVAKDHSPEVLLQLLDAAFGALWSRTKTTLGEVTLAAITERVLHNAAEKFPLFSALKVEPISGIRSDELLAQVGSLPKTELMDGIRFVLVEFLTVLGNLTAEILTPELHSGLSRVALPRAARQPGAQQTATNPRQTKGEGHRS